MVGLAWESGLRRQSAGDMCARLPCSLPVLFSICSFTPCFVASIAKFLKFRRSRRFATRSRRLAPHLRRLAPHSSLLAPRSSSDGTCAEGKLACVAIQNTEITLIEGYTNDFYEIWIESKPERNVTIEIQNLQGDNRLQIEPMTVAFTPEDWKQRHAIRVTAVDNSIVDGSGGAVYINHNITTSDVRYGLLDNLPLCKVVIVENNASYLYSWGSNEYGNVGEWAECG